MMNLRNMVIGLDSDHIARQLIAYWQYDAGTLAFWRASSNFVYTFQQDHQPFFLRFSDEQDHTAAQIEAELEFMQYLRSQGYPCVEPIRSKNGQLIQTIHVNGYEYYGVVFAKADGVPLQEEVLSNDHFFEWGRSLGELHTHASAFNPSGEKRHDWSDILHSIEETLQKYPDEIEAITELEQLTEWMQTLPCTANDYGLIHYDFQIDNICWDAASEQFHVFDFDDAHYHWFVMDIVSALMDFMEQDTQASQAKIELFLKGYRSVRILNYDLVMQFPYFLRYSRLYGYIRVLRSLEHSDIAPSEAPAWYEGLRTKLIASNESRRRLWSSKHMKE
ncbi:phosphotransferase enzyme family protein [Paenibacillus guangzhouensis]|uniref:phosphotransferase enzyme family protein n=1 Tax=Paenibacillus guangzhouensis TaxID=1473112 RepID=UPI001266EBA2|nr:phosphotransferase [Paenibacillus guangzhouensis]